jgi:alpha-tubulin suppressor-like RCC1 family protein
VACRSGALFCAGENQFRQCGVAGAKNVRTMRRAEDLRGEHIARAAGGYVHTLALTRDGRVLTLGCADDGQRGDGRAVDDETRPPVTQAALPAGVKATQVACGANHSVVLADDGTVFAFGSNEAGQCGGGAGDGDDGDDDDGDDGGGDAVLRPRAVRLPPGAGRPVRVSAGYAHTVVHDDGGHVYTFGQNDSGQLALGPAFFGEGAPDSLAAPQRALDVAAA